MRSSRLGVALLLVLAACGDGGDARRVAGVPASEPSTAPIELGPGLAPPPVLVRGGGRETRLQAWSYCWSGPGSGVCADGHPPESPPDIGDPAELEIAFAATGFRFVATAERHGVKCGRSQRTPLEPTGATTFRLSPIGPADDYDVTLAGRSTETAAEKGDLTTTFRWHTPRAGANEAPGATASIIAGRPPDVRSFGVDVAVHDLRTSPRPGRASATVVVTSASGASVTIELERRSLDCGPEGSLSFSAAKELGDRAARLGPAPFRYDVALVIDSTTYRGRGTWPDDVDPECSPCTRLQFSPPLPGL